jgi:hypothetical protein
MLLNGAAQIEEMAMQPAEWLRNSYSRQRSRPVFSQWVATWFPCISCSVTRFIDLFVEVARNIDEAANFVSFAVNCIFWINLINPYCSHENISKL